MPNLTTLSATMPKTRKSIVDYKCKRSRKKWLWPILRQYTIMCRPGSSVGIATDYGLDGPESNPGIGTERGT